MNTNGAEHGHKMCGASNKIRKQITRIGIAYKSHNNSKYLGTSKLLETKCLKHER